MKLEAPTVISTDVLIIGSGGAGLRAAIEARKHDVEVLLTCKSRAGYGNNTAISKGAFAAAVDGDLKGLRAAWCPEFGNAIAEPEIQRITRSAALSFELLVCTVEEATPAIEDPLFAAPIMLADKYAEIGHLLEEHAEELMPEVRALLESARLIPAYVFSQALRNLEKFGMKMADFFERYDLLLTPTNPVPAFLLRQNPQEINGKSVDPAGGLIAFTISFDLTGGPAATVPCGFLSLGLPIGLQIAAGWGREDILLKASAAFEKLRPWADKIPPLGLGILEKD